MKINLKFVLEFFSQNLKSLLMFGSLPFTSSIVYKPFYIIILILAFVTFVTTC